MDLFSLTSGAIGAINPMTTVVIEVNTGYAAFPGGKREPVYSQVIGDVEIQPLDPGELAHLNQMNIGGVLKKIYARGSLNSVLRWVQTGGDVVLFDNATWKVVHVFEAWPDWCAVAVAQQSASINPSWVVPGWVVQSWVN